jgi:hypothetical protein
LPTYKRHQDNHFGTNLDEKLLANLKSGAYL